MPTATLAAAAAATVPMSDPDPIVGGRVELQLLTTLKCNLKCSYCSLGVGEVLGSQTELKYDLDELDDLASAREGIDYLYWQFVAGEMYDGDSMAKRRAVLARLIESFFAAGDRLYPLVPVMGMVRNKLLPNRGVELYGGLTQCRVSTHLVNVMPDGKIFPCPDMMYVRAMRMGEIQGNWLKKSPLQPTPEMPCEGCEAFAWCRRNCMKNLWLGYVERDQRYREQVVDPICELIRFMGREIDRHDPQAWYARLPLPLRRQLISAEVYEYVEVMP